MHLVTRTLATFAIASLPLATHSAVPGGEALAGLIMGEFDTNSDTKLDQGEWQGGIGDSFADLDANGDGSIASDEVDGIKTDVASKTGDLTAGVLVIIIKQIILALDTDKDKLVSRKEYDTLSNSVFDKLDADNDKSLTSTELANLPVKLIVQ